MAAALRLDWTEAYDEDLIPRLVSWAIACVIGAAWLAVVYLTPVVIAPPQLPTVAAPPGVTYDPSWTRSTPNAGQPTRHAQGKGAQSPSQTLKSTLALAGIFAKAGTEHALEQIARMIPGVTAVQSDVGAHAAGSKAAVEARGSEGTPGMSQLGRTDAGANVGHVQGGASIAHAPVKVRSLPIVAAPALGNAVADVTAMGSFVRTRVAQLQSCYERNGGSDLAGVVALRLTIGDAGMVRSAEIERRSWSGPGAAATEQCMVDVARGWRMPFAAAGATVTIPVSFTRGA